jgi:starch synthase (maltosyl-transferring)
MHRVRPPLIQEIDDPALLAWCKYDPASGSRVLVVVNLEPAEPRSGGLVLDREALGLEEADTIHAHDLLTGDDLEWTLDDITIACTPEHPVQVYRLTLP